MKGKACREAHRFKDEGLGAAEEAVEVGARLEPLQHHHRPVARLRSDKSASNSLLFKNKIEE